MFRVEISLSDPERLVETVEAMQAWFKRRVIMPARFGYSITGARTLFRVDFMHEEQAAAFAEGFQGSIVDSTADGAV
jgi:hypothetical protein